MALDYGRKRVGVAVTDPMQIIANGLTTVSTHELLQFLADYFSKEVVDILVVGHPKQMNNQNSESVNYINPFLRQFNKKFPEMTVHLFDERFTSKLAQQAILLGGAKKKDRQDKALVDQVSATIILQDYMEAKNNINFKF